MPKAKTQKKPKYEPVLKLPPLSYEAFTALKDNIAVNGVLVPILVDSDGPRRKIIDGNYRKQIANELGYECPRSSRQAWKKTRNGHWPVPLTLPAVNSTPSRSEH